MKFATNELQEFLITDPDVRILIVEGKDDVDFWLDAVPINERRNCVVYAIDEIDIAVGEGGNKGAAIELSSIVINWKQGSRIRFFLDADNDNHLGTMHNGNVLLTDSRDFKSYALIDDVFCRLCRQGAGENGNEQEQTKKVVSATVHRVGVLRIVSAKYNLKLPFQQTFENGSVSRFFKRNGKEFELRVQSIIDALSNEANMSHTEKAVVSRHFSQMESNFTSTPSHEIVHGKDFVSFIAWYFETPILIAAGLVKLAIIAELESVKKLPNIGNIAHWVKTA